MAKSILFVTATRIGDAVLSTGILGRLIADNPGARITVACGRAAAPLFEAVPGLERIIVLDKKRWSLHWLGLWSQCFRRMW
ncbi:MAG: glycosyltransferase family 9 protein, partial [Kangiella sp.]|nr:glycosyltransferase family 9 protein [Kangiella sp.]